jgi:pantoate--beta-alanine ligase
LSGRQVQLQGAYDVGAVRELVGSWRLTHQTVALVPTMGNLHEGHLSLMRLASAHADKIVCSVFVNPTQFGRDEDFAAYPRTLAEDEALLAEQGLVNLVFAPEEAEIYPFGLDGAVRLKMPRLAAELCGASRPGHFNGVASVVLRLLNIVSPDILVLGQKDYQQLILLQRMLADLSLPIQIIGGAIHREADGLAMSSRNRYLTDQERGVAPRLHAEIAQVREALQQGDRDYAALEARASRALAEAGFRPEYVEVRRAADLGKPNGLNSGDELVVVAAAWLGRARLIDNVRV